MSAVIEALKKSLESNPEDWDTRHALIQACNAEELFNEAIDVLNGAESLPGDDAGLVSAGKCYSAVGATDQAHGIYAAALEVNPENEEAKKALAEIEAATAEPAIVEVDEGDRGAEADAMAPPPPTFATVAAKAGQEAPAPVVVRSVNPEDIDPELRAEAEFIHQAEEESERKRESSMKRDRLNAVAMTAVLHVLIFFALIKVVTEGRRTAPPQIVASTSPENTDAEITTETLKRPTQTSASSSSAMSDIVSVEAVSSFSLSNVKVDTAASMSLGDTGIDFAPSMDMGVATSGESKMMFGQKMEGDVLGVILDVSGSMAEYLPYVVREVDKNFKDAPIVYVNDVVVRTRAKEQNVRLIIPDEVKPYNEDRTWTPYWFLWHDLPRKAPQRYVDRLIETFKTRPNQFLAVSGSGSKLTDAIDFLVEQKIDSLYIFSDYEDFVNEDLAKEIGQNLGRRKIRTYVQPAKKSTENLAIMANKIARRTLGRQMPTLVSIMAPPDDVPKPLTLSKPKDMLADAPVEYATPRKEMIGKEFFDFRPSTAMTEIGRISEPEYDAVFYGPQARAAIFLKNEKGEYIQKPIEFNYHSWKRIPDEKAPSGFRTRHRKFVSIEEEPKFDGKEIVWKMVLEDELKFRVHLYIGGISNKKGFRATYVASPPNDGTTDSAHVYFRIPPMATERKDIYFGQDLPPEGLDLDHVRIGVKPNTVVFNLPRKDRDRYTQSWKLDGFEPGYNTRHFHELIRVMPGGIRDVVVQGPSFGPRKFHARTTSSKILLNGGAGRRDIEPWEGFWFSLVRPGDTREKFTKTEAISVTFE